MIYSLLSIFILSWYLVRFIYRYELSKDLLVIPNHRSSHSTPTPSGGGIAFAALSLLSFLMLWYLNFISTPNFLTLFIPGAVLTLLGFLDDMNPIPASYRLLGHFTAGLLIIYLLGDSLLLKINGWTISSHLICNVLILFYLCWLLNLYNFMDGLDGLAASQAICICLGAALIYWLNHDYNLLPVILILTASVCGFLFWNFPPAKIFMGDAGSGFLGIVLGVLSLQAAAVKSEYFWSWLILLAVFIVDATITLLRRLIQGEKIFEAHRTHAYQHASIYFKGHLPVTLAVMVINIVWLWPLALLVGLNYIPAILGLAIAYLPLIFLVFYFNAGKAIKN